MDQAVTGAEWQHLLRGALGVTVNDAAAAAVAATVARQMALAAAPAPGALFDTEPSHFVRAMDGGAAP